MALTKTDLKNIKELVDLTLDEKIEQKELVTRKDLNHLPTKTEFYNKMDEVMGELKAIREEQTVIVGRVSDHEERITHLESVATVSAS